jgi:hypothetical protein
VKVDARQEVKVEVGNSHRCPVPGSIGCDYPEQCKQFGKLFCLMAILSSYSILI